VVDVRTGEVEAAIDLGRALVNNLERVVFGSEEAVTTATVAALAGGHLLIEDVPGVGKTVLAGVLASSLGADLSGSTAIRISCPPTSRGSRSSPPPPGAGSSGAAPCSRAWSWWTS
jgi:hypothetical protein